MRVKEEVEKEESKLNEDRLTDLPVANEQAEAAKAGQKVRKDFYAVGRMRVPCKVVAEREPGGYTNSR